MLHVVEGGIKLQVLCAEASANLPCTENSDAPDHHYHQKSSAGHMPRPISPIGESSGYGRAGRYDNRIMGEVATGNQAFLTVNQTG